MLVELERVNSWGETDTTDYYRNRLLVNMERARWQYACLLYTSPSTCKGVSPGDDEESIQSDSFQAGGVKQRHIQASPQLLSQDGIGCLLYTSFYPLSQPADSPFDQNLFAE